MEIKEISFSSGMLWWNTLPNSWIYDAQDKLEKTVILDRVSGFNSKKVAIKLFFPTRNNMSGILGVEFMSSEGNDLLIEVLVNNHIEGDGSVTCSLPSHLAQTVFTELLDASQASSGFAGGVIRVNCAAWHQIDSPAYIFRLLARSIVHLLRFEEMTREVAESCVKTAMQELNAKNKGGQ